MIINVFERRSWQCLYEGGEEGNRFGILIKEHGDFAFDSCLRSSIC